MATKPFKFWKNRLQKQIGYWNKNNPVFKDGVKHRGKKKPSSLFLVPVILGIIFMVIMLVVFPLFSSFDTEYSSNLVYNVRIFEPDCSSDRVIFSKNNLSAYFLFNKGLGERKDLGEDALVPVVDFQKWEQFVNEETGSDIGYNNICVKFEKQW